jgi:hypothetical protein
LTHAGADACKASNPWLINTTYAVGVFLPSAERSFIFVGMRFFRAERKNRIQKMKGTMLPQAESAPDVGDRVTRVINKIYALPGTIAF